ncbi:hypothetical protein DSM112329_05188 [Paraconexibacter sp. AEG42_29]|uniref:MOSC domain-containing protein n=1 Tax=Paraconexibacter sp. AEG42_29 TaxID=2997339 RepID=A0AAU7B2R4_9ACTN
MAATPAGTITELHRWPVKSLAGEPVPTFLVDDRGVAGDRTHALFDSFKDAPRRLTVRQEPRMLAWAASYDGVDVGAADPPLARVTGPDGTDYSWDDPALPGALSADLGRAVTLRRDVAGQQDLERSVLITTQATLEAVTAELGYERLDLRRMRTNVHVDFGTTVPAFAEETWEGRHITLGAARFVLLHPCVRCAIPTRDPDTGVKDPLILRHLTREHGGLFGMNARYVGPADGTRVSVQDAVTVSA